MKCIADVMAPWVFQESGRLDHDAHWHRYHTDHEDWLSVFANYKEIYDQWWVELYPDPKHDGEMTRTTHETKEEAIERVVEIMEKHD